FHFKSQSSASPDPSLPSMLSLRSTHQCSTELQLKQEATVTGNKDLAEANLSLKPRLEAGKLQLTRKYQQLLEATVASVQLERLSPSTALEHLQRATDQAEQESEELTERFLRGSVSLEIFLEKFQGLRTLCHIRRTQGDKLQDRGPHAGPPVHIRNPWNGFPAEASAPVLAPSPPPRTRNLPPLSSRAGRMGLYRPNTPFAPRGPGLDLNQESLWTAKAFKLQRPHPVQKQPPYR
uniref:VPS37 C-terminal domain-containing protein n=1 Tax=Callorhinchus milii TaxID=7868 RepID=A0A4W3J1G2_CALMI